MNRVTRSLAATVSALTMLTGVGAGVVVTAAVTATSAAAADVPYTDPQAVGVIGLCDKAGNPVHGGSTTTRPFVWRAVSSVKAPAGYNGKGATATLFAFQPRQGTQPGFWSGDLLTASAVYTNTNHPMAAATDDDEPLTTNLDAYPADWDGLAQLRIYLGAPNVPAYRQTYAATDIKVTGNTWTVVRGGDVDCNSGTAISSETTLLGVGATPKATAKGKGATGATPSASASAGALAGASTTASAAPSSDASSAAALAAEDSSSSSSSSGPLVPVLAVLILLALAVGAGWYFRPSARSARATQSAQSA